MDYNIYVILSEKDLKQIGIFEIKASWGGESISYSPRRFMFDDTVQVLLVESKTTFEKQESINEDRVTLRIINGVRDLEWEVNEQIEQVKNNSIVKMLQRICQFDSFSIYIFEDDERIQQRIEYTTKKDILVYIQAALTWKSPQSIEIFSNRKKLKFQPF